MQNRSTIHRFDAIESILTGSRSRAELFADSGFQEQVLNTLEMFMPVGGILSIDVFDTLILRDNSSELTRFIEIGDLMAEVVNRKRTRPLPVKGIEAFMARYMGTQASYRASTPVQGCREGSLTEIHRTASRMLAGSDEFVEDFIDAEIMYESGRISINNMLLDILKKFTLEGGRAILISDTYMHVTQIHALLNGLGIDTSIFENIFSSADTKVSKACGGVFKLVEEKLKAAPAEFVHIGDNLKGDFKMPIHHGWHAVHLPIPQDEIFARRKDHLETASTLKNMYGLTVNIAMPC